MKEKLLAIAKRVETETWTHEDIVALRAAAEKVEEAKIAVSGQVSVNPACRDVYNLLR